MPQTSLSPKKILIPLTTLVEVDEPTEQLRADMLQSLKEAEAQIERGESVSYTPQEMKKFMMDSYYKARARKLERENNAL